MFCCQFGIVCLRLALAALWQARHCQVEEKGDSSSRLVCPEGVFQSVVRWRVSSCLRCGQQSVDQFENDAAGHPKFGSERRQEDL